MPAVVLALAAGAALALSHPPLDVGWLAFATPALLLLAVHAARGSGRLHAVLGALAGAVGYGAVLVWLVTAAGFVAWIGLTLLQAAWWALLAWVMGRWRDHPAIPVIGALAWVGVDAWRGTVLLGGFGWGTLAAAQVDNGWLVPVGRVAGEKAMILAIVLLSLAVAEAVRRPLAATRDAQGRIRWSRARAALPAGQGAAIALAGTVVVVTLATVEPPRTVGSADVLVVQGNDVETWSGSGLELDERIARQHLAETRRAIGDGPTPDLTVWAESSIDRDPARAPVLADVLRRAGELTDGRLLAGATLDGPRPSETFVNTSLHVGPDGAFPGRYVKRKLVPFGEFIPARPLFEWFPPLDQVPRDGIPADGPQALTIDGIRLAVAICFETMFTDIVRSNVLAGEEPAELLVTSTNDASFGRSGEPLQHLAQSRLRAIETGRWTVHAGVSARSSIVDPRGRLHGLTGVFTVEHLRMDVPLAQGRTPYLVTGDWLGLLTRVLLVVGLLPSLRRRPETG